MPDVATDIARDLNNALDVRRESVDWTESYDVVLFGQKYTVNAMARVKRSKEYPIIGSFKTGEEVEIEMLANTEMVGSIQLSPPVDPDQVRQQLAMAHGRRMEAMSDYQPPNFY